jgi:hypothetical protein
VLRDDLRCDDLEWEQGMGLQAGNGAVWYGIESNPRHGRLGAVHYMSAVTTAWSTRNPCCPTEGFLLGGSDGEQLFEHGQQ